MKLNAINRFKVAAVFGMGLVMVMLAAGCKGSGMRAEGSRVGDGVEAGAEARGGGARRLSPQQLAEWPVLGKGEAEVDPQTGALRLTTREGSPGMVLLSPESYGRDVVARFRIKPLQPEGVPVVLLSASPTEGEGKGKVEVPEDYEGEFSFWNGDEARTRNYTFIFHATAHQPYALLKENPGSRTLAKTLAVMDEQVWYELEIGRSGGEVWLTVDGKPLLWAKDSEGQGLPPGQLGLRLSEPGSDSFSVLYKDMTLLTDPEAVSRAAPKDTQ